MAEGCHLQSTGLAQEGRRVDAMLVSWDFCSSATESPARSGAEAITNSDNMGKSLGATPKVLPKSESARNKDRRSAKGLRDSLARYCRHVDNNVPGRTEKADDRSRNGGTSQKVQVRLGRAIEIMVLDVQVLTSPTQSESVALGFGNHTSDGFERPFMIVHILHFVFWVYLQAHAGMLILKKTATGLTGLNLK